VLLAALRMRRCHGNRGEAFFKNFYFFAARMQGKSISKAARARVCARERAKGKEKRRHAQ
jgi:hypothetical protein